MSDELLELLWVLEATLAMEPELESVLDRVVAGACFQASGLCQPLSLTKRKAPRRQKPRTGHDLFALLETGGRGRG